MLFKQVIGQSAIKEQLVELVQHNRLSHALLFLGKEGFGALPLAIAFAQYLVCEKVSGRAGSKKRVPHRHYLVMRNNPLSPFKPMLAEPVLRVSRQASSSIRIFIFHIQQ